MKVKVAQSCPTLCEPMDYIVHGILQARILDWVAFPFFRGSSQPRDQTQASHVAGRFFYQLSHQGSPRILEWVAYPFSRGSSQPMNQRRVSCTAGRFFTNCALREVNLINKQCFSLLLYKIAIKIYEHILYSAVDNHESTQALYETGKEICKNLQ